jgi:hypothetical protein
MAVDFIIETIQFKRATAADFTSVNPILLAGEPAFEIDTFKLKIGNGTTAWDSLPYVSGAGGGGTISGLSDVGDGTPTNRYALLGDGNSWESRAITVADISNISTTYATLSSQNAQDIQIATNTSNISTNSANIAINTAKVSASGSIGTHSDVDLTGISDGNVLKWNASVGRLEPTADTAATSLIGLTDVISAGVTAGNVLVANGTTGYAGRPLTTADISDFPSVVELDTSNTVALVTTLASLSGDGLIIDPINNTTSLTGGTVQFTIDNIAPYVTNVSIADIDSKGNQALITKEYADANYSSLAIEDDDVSIVSSASILNFTGSGVVVTNGTGGQANIAISSGGDAFTSNSLAQFATTTSAELAVLIPDKTGSGNVVFSNSPELVTPNLGTPSAIDLTNATNVPANDITGNIPVSNLNSGTGATASTFWRGDGTWAIPSGGGGGGTAYNNIFTEIPSGTIDGVNTTFTVSQGEYAGGSLIAFLDGQAMVATQGITETTPGSGIFDFSEAPNVGQAVYCTYFIGTPLPGIVVESDVTGVTGADQVTNIMSLTQAEYDAIGTPDVNTFYIITDAIDPSEPIATNSGSIIDLSRTGGNYMYMNAASGLAGPGAYTYANETLGGWAQVLINAATEPSIVSATKIAGASFQPSTDQYMIVFYNGNAVQYYFLDI